MVSTFRFRVVDVAALPDRVLDRHRVDLAVRAADGEQLGAIGEKLAGAALVGFDMGGLVADDAVIGVAQGGQGQGVGGGAVKTKKTSQ